MSDISNLNPQAVFKYFQEICTIPHGSGDMSAIADYCVNFAKSHSLRYLRDDANNVIIFKNASEGYENSKPVILQGHLDMVCQKTEQSAIDFTKNALDIYIDGDFIKAKDTTLGADNGIAVAMVLAILENDSLSHPPIEAVFTTDEEIGMVGALKLDMSVLEGKKMINIDSEEEDILTVSCAGGSDFKMISPVSRIKAEGTKITVTLKGLKGGHSGVEINGGRINADILAGRFLNYMNSKCDFEILSIDGGDKGNAIPQICKIVLCSKEYDVFVKIANEYLNVIKTEISAREPDFQGILETGENSSYDVINVKDQIIYALCCAPNGVMQMSAEIDGLVETSLNLGILKTENNKITMLFSLRSNKVSALEYLEQKLTTFSKCIPCEIETSGHYPPWEFKSDSELQKLYIKTYEKHMGKKPKVEAIHAGLECGVFDSAIKDLDCIAIGPDLFDVHTVKEKLSISSTRRIYEILINVLKESK